MTRRISPELGQSRTKFSLLFCAGDPEIAQSVWFMPFIEFTDLSSGTLYPAKDFDFYIQDVQGRTFDANHISGSSGAEW